MAHQPPNPPADFVAATMPPPPPRMANVQFPSDKVTFEHLRSLYPEKFDEADQAGEYGDFFIPPVGTHDVAKAADHLLLLADLVSCERIVAEGALTALVPRTGEEDLGRFATARTRLGVLYNRLRLQTVTGYDADTAISFIEAQAKKLLHHESAPSE